MRADIHDGQEHNVPFKGRIQKRKTYHLQIVTFGLQRAAGPYRSARKRHMHRSKPALLFDHVVCALLEKSSLPCGLDFAE